MTPEQDPATCAALETAVRQIAEESRDAVPTSWTDYAVLHDRGPVPPRFMARVHGLAQRYRYTMRKVDPGWLNFRPDGIALGATAGPAWPGPERLTISLDRRLSPASAARVACHEVAHIILGHTGLTLESSVDALMKRLETMAEDPAEEIAVELAAGAVCKIAGIGTGAYSPRNIFQRLHAGAEITETEIQAALLAARILWAAARPALEHVKVAA